MSQNQNNLIAAEASSQNFLERVISPLNVLERASERAAMEEGLAYAQTDDKQKQKSALAWIDRSKMYEDIAARLLADPMLSEENRAKYKAIQHAGLITK